MTSQSSLDWREPHSPSSATGAHRSNSPILVGAVVLSVLAIATGFTMWLGAAPTQLVIKPVYVYSGICALGLLYGIATGARLKWPSTLVIALLIYALLMASQVIYATVIDYYLLYNRLTFIFVTIALIVLLSRLEDISPALQSYRFSVLVCAGMVVFEFLTKTNPYGDLYFGRPGGWIANPNAAAMYIALSLPVITWRTSGPLKIFFHVATLAGVLCTFSRSGLITWSAAALLPVLAPGGRAMTTRHILVLMVTTMLALLVYANYEFLVDKIAHTSSPLLTANTQARLGTLQDYSIWERKYVLQLGIKTFFDHPVLGNGTGFANLWGYKVSVHNQIVLALIEQGLIGLIWLTFFVVSVLSIPKPFGIWIAVLFLIVSQFTHNFFDQPISGLVLAMYWLIGSWYKTAEARVGRSRAPLQPT